MNLWPRCTQNRDCVSAEVISYLNGKWLHLQFYMQLLPSALSDEQECLTSTHSHINLQQDQQDQFWGLVSCPKSLQDEEGFEPCDHSEVKQLKKLKRKRKKRILQLQQRKALVAIHQQVELTGAVSTEKVQKKRQSIWSVSKSSAPSKIKWTVKSPSKSTSKRSQVHNVKSTVCVRILTSLAVSGASALIPLLLLRGSEGWITPSSKSLFHLYPITPSSGGRARGSGTRRQDWLFIHPSPPLFLSSSSFPFPLHVSGALLALFDLKLFFFFFNLLQFSMFFPNFIHLH